MVKVANKNDGKYQHDTWYRLVDGTLGDPNEVKADDDGKLINKNGVPVAYRDDGNPQTVGVEYETNMNKEAVEAGKEGERQAAEMLKADDDAAKAAADKPAEEVGQTDVDPATGEKTGDSAGEADGENLAPIEPAEEVAPKKRGPKAKEATGYKNREFKSR